MEFKDYYAILGVDEKAELKDIRAAYRKLARKYHPDVSDHTDAEQKFKEVAEAWQVLKDPEKRAEYDQLKAHGGRAASGGFEPPPGWQTSGSFEDVTMGGDFSDSGFSDFFETLFGRGAHPGNRQQSAGRRGQDMEMELPVFLEELVSGEPRKIAWQVPELDDQGRPSGTQEKQLNVRIPTGVSDGEVIRLKGQGAPGSGKASAGDLYLRIRLVPHPLFDVEGSNLILTLPLAPWEAALGTQIRIPTLDGELQLKIPPNTQAGRKLRLKGKGLPTRDKNDRGDLLAVVRVVMPDTNNGHSQELWQQLASEQTAFDPRKEWSRP